jgi:hypothetical protein
MEALRTFLSELTVDRKAPVTSLLTALNQHLPQGFEPHSDGRMAHFSVPHSLYPNGYHCNPKQPLPFISVASMKGHVGFYHMGLYADPTLQKQFLQLWEKANCGKLDMGKSCVRFKRPAQLIAAMPALIELMKLMSPQEWISCYEQNFKA